MIDQAHVVVANPYVITVMASAGVLLGSVLSAICSLLYVLALPNHSKKTTFIGLGFLLAVLLQVPRWLQ